MTVGLYPATAYAATANPPRRASLATTLIDEPLAHISHHLTVEARNRRASTSLRLLAVLNVL